MHPNPVIQHLYDQLDQRKNRQQQIIPNPIIKALPNDEQ